MENQRKHILVFICIGLVVLAVGFFLEYDKSIPIQGASYELQTHKGDGLWYYEIYEDGQLLIRQEQIPAVRGAQYFRSEKDAQSTGRLVVKKLRERQTPSITISELNQHGITFKE